MHFPLLHQMLKVFQCSGFKEKHYSNQPLPLNILGYNERHNRKNPAEEILMKFEVV